MTDQSTLKTDTRKLVSMIREYQRKYKIGGSKVVDFELDELTEKLEGVLDIVETDEEVKSRHQRNLYC